MFKINKFYSPEDGVDANKGELTKDETIEFLNADDEVTEVLELKDEKKIKEDSKDDKKEDEEEESDDEEEKDELDELEEELEEVDDEKIELMAPARRKDILRDYPGLFKKYPYLEHAYYREQKFTELLPTIEDAKIAVDKAEVLDKFSADLGKGDLGKAIAAVKSHGDVAFNKLVDDYLPNLARVDKEAYHHVIGNVAKTIIMQMIEQAGDDADQKVAAQILNKFMFNTDKVAAPALLTKPGSDKDPNDEINNERAQILQEKFEEALEGVNTKVGNILKSTILANIDPKESMTEYVRKTAARDCQERLETALENDKRLANMLDKLWQAARKDNFSKQSVEKAKSAYLSVARTLLPTVLKQARNEALKGLGKRVKEDDNDEDTSKKGPIPAGKTASNKSVERSSTKTDREKAKAIPPGMSSRDYLMQD